MYSPSSKEINEILEVYRRFPLLIPSKNYKKWEGFLLIEDSRYQIMLIAPCYPSLKYCKFFISEKVSFSFNENELSLLGFLTSLEKFIKENIEIKKSPEHSLSLKYLTAYANVVRDVENLIGSENIEIEKDLKWIILKYRDFEDRLHLIKVSLTLNYPSVPLDIINIDLPEEVIHNLKGKSSLGELYTSFIDSIGSLSTFWNMCDKLADETWILEPVEPKRKDIHRRILISDNLSVYLVFNPLNPLEMPDVKFLGSLTAVSQARTVYQSKLQCEGWSDTEDVIENLTRLLGLDCFPRKSKSTIEDSAAEKNECIICYMSSLENQPPPAKWCSNAHCSGWFHHSCLLEWLNSVPTSKTAFDHISGPCPHCDEKLFCPIVLS